jgi:hypothetical protein
MGSGTLAAVPNMAFTNTYGIEIETRSSFFRFAAVFTSE